MKILLISNIFHPDRAGGAAVHSDLCYRLTARGHKVQVHAAYPYYPEWENKSGANLWRRKLEVVNGIPVLRHGIYIPRRPGKMRGRLLQEASFFASLLRSVFRAGKVDVVVAVCPLMSVVAVAWLMAKLSRAKLWVNVQDIMSDAADAAGFAKGTPIVRIARWVEDFFMRRAHVLSSIAPKMIARLEDRTERPVLFFPNWLNASMENCVRQHGPKRGGRRFCPARLLYAGNIGRKQGLVELCEELRRSTAIFEMRIFGEGAAKPDVLNWHARHSDPRFLVGDFLTENDFVQELYGSDLFVISETPDVGASFIPSKLIPSIATGTPICAVCEPSGPLGAEVSKYRLGYVWNWSEIESFVDLLRRPAQMASDFELYHRNCLDRAQDYTGEFAVKLFTTIASAPIGGGNALLEGLSRELPSTRRMDGD